MARCPNCDTEGCYNSGFTVDCVNEECHYYSEKQAKIFSQERKTEPPGAEEEEELIDIDWGLAGAPTWTWGEATLDAEAPTWTWDKIPIGVEVSLIGNGKYAPVHRGPPSNVDLDSSGECVLCDAGIPKKSFTVGAVVDDKGHRRLARFPKQPSKTDANRAVTGGLPNWLWEVCSGLAKNLSKDPVDLTKAEVILALLRKEPCASCGEYECRQVTRRCREG